MQPALFDTDGTSRQSVNRQRDAALRQVLEHAEERRRDFLRDATAFVVRYLGQWGPTSGEKLTTACKAAGITAHDDRAFGPVYSTLARRGVIEKVGTVRRERGHGTAGGNVWGLVR